MARGKYFVPIMVPDEIISGIQALHPNDEIWQDLTETYVQFGFEDGMKAYIQNPKSIPNNMDEIREYGDPKFWEHYRLIVEDGLATAGYITPKYDPDPEEEVCNKYRRDGDQYNSEDITCLTNAMMAGHVMAMDYIKLERDNEHEIHPISFDAYRVDHQAISRGEELVDIPF